MPILLIACLLLPAFSKQNVAVPLLYYSNLKQKTNQQTVKT
jgi:hypothetical protein